MSSVNDKPEILSHLGVGSGIDTTALIDSLVQAEVAGSQEDLANKQEKFEAEISAFSTIKNNLKVFSENLRLLSTSSDLGYVGSSSNTTVATFEASGTTAAQTINSSLTVSALATQHTLTGPTYASTNNTVGARTISIDFGTWSADPTAGGGQTHTSNGKTTVSVTTTSSTTLLQLRDMINSTATDSDSSGSKDVSAFIFYDGSNYMLALKSEYGADNEMKVVDSGNGDYAYNESDGAELTQTVAGANASFVVDGVNMTRNNNTITDLYPGLTLELLSTTSSPIALKSDVDLSKAQESLESFVLTYNDLYLSLETLRTNNQDTENPGLLAGDSLLRNIMSTLRDSNARELAGYAGGPYYLSNLGVNTNRDGTISFSNPDMLKRQFENNAESLRSFFKNQIQSDNSEIEPLIYSVTDTKPGSYDVVKTGSSVTIGGIATSGSGTEYTVSSGDPNGIKINVTAAGNTSGTIHYGRSYLTLLEEDLEAYIKYSGLIDSKIEGNNSRLKDLVQAQENLDQKIEKLYARYRTQYSYMESSIAALEETGNMLSSAFAQKD
jgi:flagellar hook-associated protein 2